MLTDLRSRKKKRGSWELGGHPAHIPHFSACSSHAPAPEAAESTQADGTPGPCQSSLKNHQPLQEENEKTWTEKAKGALAQHQDKLRKRLSSRRREGFCIACFLFKLEVLLKYY